MWFILLRTNSAQQQLPIPRQARGGPLHRCSWRIAPSLWDPDAQRVLAPSMETCVRTPERPVRARRSPRGWGAG